MNFQPFCNARKAGVVAAHAVRTLLPRKVPLECVHGFLLLVERKGGAIVRQITRDESAPVVDVGAVGVESRRQAEHVTESPTQRNGAARFILESPKVQNLIPRVIILHHVVRLLRVCRVGGGHAKGLQLLGRVHGGVANLAKRRPILNGGAVGEDFKLSASGADVAFAGGGLHRYRLPKRHGIGVVVGLLTQAECEGVKHLLPSVGCSHVEIHRNR